MAESTSDTILDSLFNDVAKTGYFNVEEHFKSFATKTDAPGPSIVPPKKLNLIPLARKESPAPIIRKLSDTQRSPSPTVVESGKKPSRIIGSIKIASLKESTKSQIIESTGDQRQQRGKFSEEGEILPSDIGSGESESDVEFDVIDEADGELAPSDSEKKKSEKKHKKKKKHEHRRHRHDREKRRKSRKDSEISPKRRSISRDPKKIGVENERNDIRQRRPWEKMINFHLSSNQRYDRRYSERRIGSLSPLRQDSRSRIYPSSFRTRHSRSPSSSRRDFNIRGERRRDYSRRDFGSRERYSGPSAYGQFNSKAWRLDQNFGHERLPRKLSRSRSPQKSRSNDVSSIQRTGTLDHGAGQGSPIQKKEDDDDGPIDKKKLYEIARRNAAAMLKSGELQKHLSTMSAEDLVKLRSGGKSVEDLIEYCRKIQQREAKKADGETSSSDEGETKKDEGEDELDAFIRHPFALKPQTSGFVFNVKNVIQLPVKTPAERAADDAKLRITFPISSGEQHRNELEWVPVSKSEKPKEHGPKKSKPSTSATPFLALPPPPSPPTLVATPPANAVTTQPMEQAPVDVSEVVSNRLKAIQRLNDNANDVEAMKMLKFAEEQLQRWVESKNIPGLFTGSAPAEAILTQEQSTPPDFRYSFISAWAKKDTLINAKPVSSGVGMQLMQKMGWRPGEGLGKNREGTLEPLLLEVKSDRKGLLASEEGPNQRIHSAAANMRDFQGKHPVSALMELCSKRRWGAPEFSCFESGPSHDRRFTWQAIVNGVEYQTATPASNKKAGKAQVCQVVLQSLGLVPRDKSLPIVIG